MGNFSVGQSWSWNTGNTLKQENTYKDLVRQGGAGDYGDIESFYTPEMQQSVLAEMGRVAQEEGSRAQAGISGSAVRSGFGVGNTSREMARRSNAESDMLNQIVQGHVSNAQNIEAQRTAQAQAYAQTKFNADQKIADNKLSQELTQLGYQEQLDAQQKAFKADANAARMTMVGGALNTLGQAAGDYFGSRQQAPTSPGGIVNVAGVGNVADTRGAVWYNPQDYRP